MAKCPNCSWENADTQRFCGECGTPLPLETGPHTQSYPRADETVKLPTAELASGMVFAKRYQVIEELGTGGMGRVFRVLDKRLGEEIALKLIRPEIASDRATIERFSAELKLARQIVHKNVARMFDINDEDGVPFITMEYVQGENLKRLIRKVGRLDPRQAIPVACQICDGLSEAHRLGIIHRDLKPQNVMIDEDGHAKIMDFGLARLLVREGSDASGSRSGTPAYVSPEQIQGLAADGRSDIYSLGVLMYETLTGSVPFKGATVDEIVQKHVTERPRDPRELNPGISTGLSQVVMRCLEKDPAKRYQSAAEVLAAFEGLSDIIKPGPSAGAKRWLRVAGAAGALAIAAVAALILLRQKPWESSLAVLPVEAAGTEARHQSLLEGLQSEITDRLSGIPGLRVLPRLSVNSFDIRGKSSPEIGKLLGVKYLLSLKVQVEGDRVDAKIYLIDAKRDSFPPPLTYSKDSPDYRFLQDEIARYTARTLGKAVAEEQLEKIGRRGTDNIEAYNLYLEGMKLIEEQSGDKDIKEAIEKYLQAIAIDPDYALAYWGAGNAYENLYYSRPDDKDPAALEKMYEYFSRASHLDPGFAETNLGLGWYYFNKGDNPRAFASFKKALELEPHKYIVNHDAGAFLTSIGLYEQGIRRLAKAAELSPRETLPLVQIAQSWLYLGRCEQALRYAKRAVAIDGSDPDAGVFHALLLSLTGRLDEADREIDALTELGAQAERLSFLRELTTALKGDREQADVFRSGKPTVAPQGTYAYLLFGMKDEAITNIQAGIDGGLWRGMYLYSYPSLVENPWFKDLRGDPRFRAILERQKGIYLRELKALEKL